MKKALQNKNGQSLVEVIIAMTILIIATSAAMTVVVSSKNLLYMAEGQTKATALAQEGIEIVRNNRDVGCAFNSLLADTITTPTTSCHAIKSDTDNTSENKIVSITNCTSGSSDITSFAGFNRVIYLYNLSDVTWNPGSFGLAGTFDAKSNYYYITVKVSWKDKTGDRDTEISTIMLKRWKD